jgi:hypothetical protein
MRVNQMNYWRSVFVILSDCRRWGGLVLYFLGALPNAGPRSGSLVIRTLAVGRKMIYPFCDAQNSDRPAVENGLD